MQSHKSASVNLPSLEPSANLPEVGKSKQYRNKYDDDYQAKLAWIQSDIETGVIDRLTMKIGRERYKMRDTRTRQAQIDLSRAGLLVKSGRRYAVAA